MRNKIGTILLSATLAMPAAAEAPLSAIDWLDEEALPVVDPPPVRPAPPRRTTPPPPVRSEPAVTPNARPPEVSVQPLGQPSAEAVGLLAPSVTGLPADLWSGSDAATLVRLMDQARPDTPAMVALLNTLLLAEARPPLSESPGAPSLLAARIGRLIEDGAVDAALALLDRAGPDTPALLPLWLEAALLQGDPGAACRAALGPAGRDLALASRIHCMTRAGRWADAVVTLEAGRALGALDARDADLLARFLDPDAAEGLPDMPPARNPTVLQFRLSEALGVPMPIDTLPRRFAHIALGGDMGWRTQLVAAERLSRAGTLEANRLLGIYTLREPAASGGIWDRVAALQAVDDALVRADDAALARALPGAWRAMREAGLLVAFSEIYAGRLARQNLSSEAARLAARAGLLSSGYEAQAARLGSGAEGRFLAAIARGTAPGTTVQDLPHAAQIAAAFTDPDSAAPAGILTLARTGRLGEALLRTLALFETGAAGDSDALSGALAALRAMGLEDTARRAALQLMLAEAPA